MLVAVLRVYHKTPMARKILLCLPSRDALDELDSKEHILRKKMPVRDSRITRLCLFLVAGFLTVLAAHGSHCFGQDTLPQGPGPPAVELLALSGSKPNLTPTGEGITSIKTSDLYKRGVTQVKSFDSTFKIELPVGYTLFNNLAYMIDTEAVFSGPTDFAFSIPSAVAKESFEKLRILVADYDDAEPQKPRWIDVTLMPELYDSWKEYLTKVECEKRLPNFGTHSLHAFMWQRSRVLVVATKDSSVARDNFVADIAVTAKPEPESVMEGREIRYTFKITNNGPDTATQVAFRSHVEPDLVSLNQSQGTCRWEAYNIYCNLGEIPKGATATITYQGTCSWDFYIGDQPGKSGGMDASPLVAAAEGDANYENNQVFASASVVKDPNKAPVVAIVSPTEDQFFVGPGVTVNIVANAHDPDGAIGKIEFYDGVKPIGTGKLTRKDKYELSYANVSYGQHLLTVLVADNQGRPGESGLTSFFVNGQAKVQIVSPSAKQVISGPLDDIAVTVHASDPTRQLKKVTVHLGIQFGGMPQVAEPTAKKDEYTTTFKGMGGPGTHTLYTVVTDDAGVETITYPIEFRIAEPPSVRVYVVEGEYAKDIKNGAIFRASKQIELESKIDYSYDSRETGIVKFELFANGKLICKSVNTERKESNSYDHPGFKCLWSPARGRYTLVAVATDSDGEIGKSTPVEVVIR